MTEIQPAHYTEGACHTAQGDRQVLASFVCDEGVAFGANGGDDLAVSDGASGMQVVVGSGNAFIQGDTIGWQGIYHVTNDGNVTLTLASGDVTDDRIDTIIARVYDADYAGVLNEWALEVLAGDPSPAPVPETLPDNAIALAFVTVAAGASTLAPGDIEDARTPYALCTPTFIGRVIFTASDTFEKADYPGLRALMVKCQGGGASGGGSEPTFGGGDTAANGGGGAGSCAEKFLLADAIDDVVTVTVGAGGDGSASSDGEDGESTSFGAHCIGLGGNAPGVTATAGSTPDAIPGGSKQTGGTGDIVYAGGAGGVAYRSDDVSATFSGYGGNAHLGGGASGTTVDGDGFAGGQYGGGGSGSKTGDSAPLREGGDGGPGVCIVDMFG